MNEQEIHDFLVDHPDYLTRHPDLLSRLHIPHPSGGAVSLVERQVSVLRERNVDLRHQLRDLDSTARHNDQLFAGTRALVLALLDAKNPEALETALTEVLREEFATEYASLLLFEGAAVDAPTLRRIGESDARNRLRPLIGKRGAGCGALRADEFALLFDDTRLMGSAAVSLITRRGTPLGLLAVGSADTGRYGSDMGTLFLEFAAEVIGRLLPTGVETT